MTTGADGIDVVVPYFDAPEMLTAILESLARQRDPDTGRPLGRSSVIVADDASSIRPPPSHRGIDVRVVRHELAGYHAASARNLGAGAATGDVIVFLDGDTVPDPFCVARLAAPIRDGRADLVTGRRRHADFDGLAPDAIAEWVAAPTEDRVLGEPTWLADGLGWTDRLRTGTSETYQYVISAVMAVRRRTVLDVGGFDDRFDSYGGEDWEFAYRVWNGGWDLEHVPDAIAFHDGPDIEGRGEDPTAKTTESLRIVDLVPASATRCAGVHHEVPDLDVTLEVDPHDLAANARCVYSLLSQQPGDLVVTLDGASVMVDRLDELIHDPRVRRTVDGGASDRTRNSRCSVSVSAPVDFGPRALDALCGDVAHGAVARRRAEVGGATIVATSARLRRRGARTGSPVGTGDLVDGSTIGIDPVDTARFADWARRRADERAADDQKE